MQRVFFALVIFTTISFAQESNEDTTGLKDAVQSFLGLNQPKLGFMAQFAGEVYDHNHYTSSTFTIRNLRMYFTGSVGEHFKFLFQGDLNGSYQMLDLKLSYILNEHLRIDGGRFKTPFGEEYLVNDAKLLFVNRSMAASNIGTFRKYGLQVQSSLLEKRLTIAAGAFNGENTYPKKISLFIGKVKTIPITFGDILPDLQIEAGGSVAYTNKEYDLPSYFTFVRNNHILYNASTKLIYHKYWFGSEYYVTTSNRVGSQEGIYVDLGGAISASWEVVGRFDWFAYRHDVYHDSTSQSILSISRNYLIGINYYPINYIKLQLDFERDYTNKINWAWLNFQYAINFE